MSIVIRQNSWHVTAGTTLHALVSGMDILLRLPRERHPEHRCAFPRSSILDAKVTNHSKAASASSTSNDDPLEKLIPKSVVEGVEVLSSCERYQDFSDGGSFTEQNGENRS